MMEILTLTTLFQLSDARAPPQLPHCHSYATNSIVTTELMPTVLELECKSALFCHDEKGQEPRNQSRDRRVL